MSQYNGGGGFLTHSSPYGGSQSPGGSGKKQTSQALRPLTIRQCLSATQTHSDAELFIDDAEVGQLTVVGTVVSVNTQATNIVFWIDDGTARIEARHWMDSSSEDASEKFASITENTYVRVFGVMKNFGNKRYINATHIRPIADPHEVFFHMLEAMFVHNVLTRGQPPKPGEHPSGTGTAVGGHTGISAYTGTTAGGGGGSDQFAHLPPLQRRIIEFILSQPPREEGTHVAAIARAVREDAHKISEALDALMDEGHVYSTIDESHFNVSQ